MKPFIEIMRLLRGDKWQRDALAADAVRFIETGDPAALARLQKARRPKWWGGLLDALDQHYATPTDADWRVYQTAAILLSAEDVRTWLKGSERKGRIWAPVLPRIMRFDEQQFRGLALKVARDTLDAAAGAGPPWTTETFGVEVLPNALSCLERGAAEGQWGCALRQSFLTRMVKAMGKEALPAVLFGLQDEWIHRTAVGHLIDLDDGTHAGLIQQALEAGLQHKDSGEVIDYVELATRWRLEVLAERLWSLLEHKSKLVREAAARALSRLGEAALPRAGQLLRHRKADVRLAVVGLLAAVGTTAALDLLKPWADKDSSGFVQDAIRKVLASAGVAGPSVGRDAILARVREALPKIKGVPARWLKENSLPPLRDADGQLIDRDTVRYLLHRQARAGKVELDLEARALCDLIDRRSSGDFALLLLKGYLTAGANLQDRWALVLACLLGDDRIVPPLHSQIRTWAESQQPNRAEDAVRALALARTDAALMTLDALAVRYRSKRPYLGEEAAEGFTRAAQQQGLTLDELGDRVVPWLGFEPGKPRLLVWAKRQLEVRIGLNFKFEFLDRQTGKALKALPAGVPEALQKDHREQSGMLKEAVKAQLTRLENLLVRGHRWPVGRWRELFLAHPLLIPFAVRLVWGIYDASGGLTGTFRALEDGSLTGADDSGMSLPAAGSVGIVHPLELDADARKAWQRHLADYEIEPPFPQLERPVLSVPPGQKRAKVATDHAGAVVMAGTFRNRAEKLGWGRTAVSGGRIVAYGKRFTGAGLDALVGLEDMYVGANWDDEIALGRVCFVRSAGEGRGTYADVPDESNPDLVPLGKVPPVVYSEVMGDLKRIVGQKAHVEEESF